LTPAEEALHRNLLVSVGELRKSLVRTSYYLVQVGDRRIHRKMGFASLAAYAARYLGLTAKQTEGFVTMGRKLPRFPEVARALDDGTLTWSQARLITRRAKPGAQQEWVERARGLSVRGLAEALPKPQAEVKREAKPPRLAEPLPIRRPVAPQAARPQSKPKPADAKQYFTLGFESEQYALFERLLAAVEGESKEQKILSALAGESARISLPHLLVIMECPACGEAAVPTSRGEVAASPALLAAAECSATVETDDGGRRQSIPPRLRRKALQRARHRCQAEGCNHTQFLEIHHRVPVASCGGSGTENLVVLCAHCHRKLHDAEASAREALHEAP